MTKGLAITSSWTEPGAYAVAPGVHRIPLPLPMDGLRAVNVYAVEAGDGVVLVDSGWAVPDTRAALEDGLAAAGATLADVSRCLVTHYHKDHYTHAVALRRDLGIPVTLGIGEQASVELLSTPGAAAFTLQQRQLRRCGAEDLLQRLHAVGFGDASDQLYDAPDSWFEPPTAVTVGERLLSVLPTPGHTVGHVVFADVAGGLLFAGDHVLPDITPSIGFETVVTGLPLADYVDSLRAMLALPDLLLLPAHGPVAPSTHNRVRELLAHHSERLAVCESRVHDGLVTAFAVAGSMTWTRRERAFADLDLFNRMLATIEVLAHLDVLAAEGRVTAEQAGEVTRFHPPAAWSGRG